MTRAIAVTLGVFLVPTLLAQGTRSTKTAEASGAVLFSAFENRSLDVRLPATLASLRPDVRTEIERRLARRRTYTPKTPAPPPGADLAKKTVADARRKLEAGIVALLETPKIAPKATTAIEAEAARYARAAVLASDWEGFADGPFAEAEGAEKYVRAHPRTALRPYLDLFLLHRYRCAFEAAAYEVDHASTDRLNDGQIAAIKAGNIADERRAASAYLDVWQRIAVTPDPVVRAIADDMDQTPALYVFVNAHPRTFKS
jgi:hypothetical protein